MLLSGSRAQSLLELLEPVHHSWLEAPFICLHTTSDRYNFSHAPYFTLLFYLFLFHW